MATVKQSSFLQLGEVQVEVTATRVVREPFKGIIKTVPGMIHSLIIMYAMPDQDVSPYFLRMLHDLGFIQLKDPKGQYENRWDWEITDKGKSYVQFLCGEISE